THVIGSHGRAGIIVPSGIATDSTTQYFFRDLVERAVLVSLFDFENKEGIFPAVHRSFKFCLLTVSGIDEPKLSGAEFVFFARDVTDIVDANRRFRLTASDVSLINPNTKTCP